MLFVALALGRLSCGEFTELVQQEVAISPKRFGDDQHSANTDES